MRHQNYYADNFRGQTIYRCCQCAYDSFALDNIQYHAANHPRIYIHDILGPKTNLIGKRVVIGVITCDADWPTRSIELARAEVNRLQGLGVNAQVYWVDNGSTQPICQEHQYADASCLLPMNLGQSVGRNHMISYCELTRTDYLMLIDGDIEVIPYSSVAMLDYLVECKDNRIGCVGLYSRNCTDRRDNIAQVCTHIYAPTTSPGMAWTQYGMFDCRMFVEGIRFDDSEVFKGPGWGFEDDDLYCQMLDKGWSSVNTKYFRYAHMSLNSSLNWLDPTLAAKVWSARKSYVFNKWAGNPRVSDHVNRMVNQSMPVLTPRPASATI